MLLVMPVGSKPVAILCLGYVDAFYPVPMLVQENWTTERPIQEFVFHNTWDNTEMPE